MKKIIATIFLLTSCASQIEIPQEYKYAEIKTDYFTIASWQKINSSNAAVKIYIEGDGNSFNSKGYPTNNPTPRGKFFRGLAFNDVNENVVYLARPCQFVNDEKCTKLFWTTGRFAPEVIQSMASAIKEVSQDSEVELVGFSGGGQVAGLVAVLHPEINVKFITNYAPNLNHETWTRDKRLLPLKDSMSLNNWQNEYLQIEQMTYIPEKDKIIEPYITIDFLKGDENKYKIVKGKGHNF
ncbi:MAG: hypothetical protein R3Y43_05405 [Alphaproteobacteria bacterium]